MKKHLNAILFLACVAQSISCKDNTPVQNKTPYTENSENHIKNENSSSEDCEVFIKAYDEYVDDVVALMNKMKDNPDDMTVITDYTTAQLKLAEWADKLETCKEDERMAMEIMKINLKLAKAK